MSQRVTKPTKWRAPSEDSDQPGHPPSMIRVFAVRIKKTLVVSYPLSAQQRLSGTLVNGSMAIWSQSKKKTRSWTTIWVATVRCQVTGCRQVIVIAALQGYFNYINECSNMYIVIRYFWQKFGSYPKVDIELEFLRGFLPFYLGCKTQFNPQRQKRTLIGGISDSRGLQKFFMRTTKTDQTAWIQRLITVYFGRICQKVRFGLFVGVRGMGVGGWGRISLHIRAVCPVSETTWLSLDFFPPPKHMMWVVMIIGALEILLQNFPAGYRCFCFDHC